jgi:DNA polymerase-3 subunit gamma/tau
MSHAAVKRTMLSFSMAIALARKYRPRKFSDLIVQDHVANVLRGAIARHRVGHGYLLTGPRGVGKTTAARILAMALNCENKDKVDPPGEPCGECVNCTRIWSGSANLDVVEIDAASNRGVDDARELRERAMYAASQPGHYKVYIVDEAHMLTREAWNALLKILEEPPPGVVFVFATTEPQKIAQSAAPVMSRLQRFDFRRIGPGAIRDRLRDVAAAEGIQAEEDALTLIARGADGGMRDALSVLDQCLSFGEGILTVRGVRSILGLVDDELYGQVLAVVAEHRAEEVFPLIERLLESGADLGEFMNGAAEMLRSLLMLQLGAEPEGLTDGMRQQLEQYKSVLAPGDVLRMLKLLADQEIAIRRSANPRLMVETLLLRWSLMDQVVNLEELLANLGGPGSLPPQGTPPSRPTPTVRSAPPPRSEPPRAMRDSVPVPSAPPPEAPEAVALPPAESPVEQVAFTVEALASAWPDIVADARRESPFLGEALGAARPLQVAPPGLTIELLDANPLVADRLTRQREVVQTIVSRRVGAPVHLSIGSGTRAPDQSSRPGPKRMSDSGAKAERLRTLRKKDPALDAAADELDLEIVD